MARPVPVPTIRQQAHAALQEFGLRGYRLTHLASRHNDVLRVDLRPGKKFILRIQNDLLTDVQARSQLLWLDSLARDSDVTVPTPIRTIDGRPFTHVELNGSRRRAVLLTYLPGRMAKQRTDAFDRAAAAMMAQMHDHAETFRQPAGFACRQLNANTLFGEAFFVRAKGARGRLTSSQRKTTALAETMVRDAMHRLGRGRQRFGVIHADLNLANIVLNADRACPIDFDEFGMGWYLFDLAELIRTSINVENWQQRKALAISAYTAHRDLSPAEVDAFDAFIVATFVQYLNWAFNHARSAEHLKWVPFCMEVLRTIIRSRTRFV